jgi:hypothetical protein
MHADRTAVIDVDALDQRSTITLAKEDATCGRLHVENVWYPDDNELRAEESATVMLTPAELGHLAAHAADLQAELAGADPFATCFDVETYLGEVQWTIATGPDHSKTGETPRHVRLRLGDGAAIDLPAADAVRLAAALAEHAGELI